MADDPSIRDRLRQIPREWADRADQRVLSLLLERMSVPTQRTRAWLRGRRLPFVDPKRPSDAPRLSLHAIDYTADQIIARYARQASFLGLAAGVGGAASIPPEVLASAVGTYRLAQRLCVVYGFDPETDRGQMALWRALAHAYDLELPESGLVSLRASDLPSLVSTRQTTEAVGGTLTRAALRSTAWRVAGRVTRFVPLVAAIGSANSEHRQFRRIGEEMKGTLRRLAELPERAADIEDAVEIDVGD